jgi:hypothetical protein
MEPSEGTLRCPYCSIQFTWTDNLKRHTLNRCIYKPAVDILENVGSENVSKRSGLPSATKVGNTATADNPSEPRLIGQIA